jgi:hypothetical protein
MRIGMTSAPIAAMSYFMPNNLKAETKAFKILKRQIARLKRELGVDKLRFRIGNWSGDVTDIKQLRGAKHADFILCENGREVFYIGHKERNFGRNGYGSIGRREILTNLNKHRDPRFRGWAHYVYDHLASEFKRDGLRRTGHLSWRESKFKGLHTIPPDDLTALIVYGPEATSDECGGALNFTPLVLIGEPIVTRFPESDRVFNISSKDGSTLHFPNIPTDDNAVYITAHERVGRSQKKRKYGFRDRKKSFTGWIGAFPYRELKYSLNSDGSKMSQSLLVEYPMDYIEKWCKRGDEIP